MKRSGLTLIETIIGIVVISIAFYALIMVFATIAPKTAAIENIDKKAFLAQEKMEETLAIPWTSLPTQAAGAFTGSFSNYQFKIATTMVATADLTTPATSNIKRIYVDVWEGSGGKVATVELTSLLTQQ
jgi:Tfp pilus assembly protein PilV